MSRENKPTSIEIPDPQQPQVGEPNPFSQPSTPYPAHNHYAFIGLGNMGSAMALNMAKHLRDHHQPPLTIWNRSSDRVEKFQELAKKEGLTVQVGESLEEIGKSCDFIITSLGSDQAAVEVYEQLFKGQEAQHGKGDGIVPGGHGHSTIFVDTSTLYHTTSGQLERQCAAGQCRYFLSCPVFGTPPVAQAAQLLLVISGNYHAKKHVARALVPALGRKIMDFGSDVEKASRFKLIGNSMILATIELCAETMTLADRSGIRPEQMYEYIQDFFPAPSFLTYGKKIMDNDFHGEEGFTLQGGIQDASHIRRLAEESSVPMPIMDIAHQHLVAAKANGGEKLDWSSLVGGQRISAGLPPFSRPVSGIVFFSYDA